MADKYDDEIEVIATATFPEIAVEDHWTMATNLFQFCRPSISSSSRNPQGIYCGCLTMVREGTGAAWTPELTEEIRDDYRIHKGNGKLKRAVRGANGDQQKIRDILQPYAEWQRRLDREIRQLESSTP